MVLALVLTSPSWCVNVPIIFDTTSICVPVSSLDKRIWPTRASYRFDCNLSAIERLDKSLRLWQVLTSSPPQQLPNDLQLRRCNVAHSLRLPSKIRCAGGYRHVRQELNLISMNTSKRYSRQKELTGLARDLERLCKRIAHPSPRILFPHRRLIQLNDPVLANRIAAYPSRAGYSSLLRYFQTSSIAPDISSRTVVQSKPRSISTPKKNQYGKWVNPDYILKQLEPYQRHPKVMPSLNSIPSTLAAAIQRQGGSRRFAHLLGLVQHKNYEVCLRFKTVVGWLALHACDDLPFSPTEPVVTQYIHFIQSQSQSPPPFPFSQEIPFEILREIYRMGDKKTLALRLGYGEKDVHPGLFMGSFSIQFAYDILNFALENVTSSSNGCVAMPTSSELRITDNAHLLCGIEFFGGEFIVGRRLGLIPPMLPLRIESE